MSLVEVARLPTRQQAEGLCFTLEAVGIETVLREEPGGNGSPAFAILVEERREEAARQIVLEELGAPAPRAALAPLTRALGGGLLATLGLMLVLALVFVAEELLGGSQAHSTLLRFGASLGPRVLGAGEWWRTVTAAFLHIGPQHLLANLAALFVFGALSRERFGPGRLLFLWLVSALLGNWTSLALSPGPVLRAGASGGIFGLFGALAGARLRQLRAPRATSRFRTWHVVAATLAFLGLTVGSGPTDYPAHLGGLLGGALLGLLLPPADRDRAADRRLELGLGATVALLAGLAAALAWRG